MGCSEHEAYHDRDAVMFVPVTNYWRTLPERRGHQYAGTI